MIGVKCTNTHNLFKNRLMNVPKDDKSKYSKTLIVESNVYLGVLCILTFLYFFNFSYCGESGNHQWGMSKKKLWHICTMEYYIAFIMLYGIA